MIPEGSRTVWLPQLVPGQVAAFLLIYNAIQPTPHDVCPIWFTPCRDIGSLAIALSFPNRFRDRIFFSASRSVMLPRVLWCATISTESGNA